MPQESEPASLIQNMNNNIIVIKALTQKKNVSIAKNLPQKAVKVSHTHNYASLEHPPRAPHCEAMDVDIGHDLVA